MFPLPPKGDAHWVYDDPSGVPETPTPVQVPQKQKPDKVVVRFPIAIPSTPKAA